MSNFTKSKGKSIINKLPLFLGCVLATSLYAQTGEQIEAIRKQTNLKELRVLERTLEKDTPSARVLRAEAKKKNIPFSGVEDGRYYELYRFDKRTGNPIYRATYNAGAAKGTQTDKLYSEFGEFDLSGEGMKIHEWDGGGVLASHVELTGRVTQKDTPQELSSHSTHVAGTLIATGVNPNAKGMAYKATLDAYDWGNDIAEMTAAAATGALVSNHSYGFLGGFEFGQFFQGKRGWYWFGLDEDTEYYGYGAYGETDRNWDMVTYNTPYYLPVKAAGNPRGGGPEPGGLHYVKDNKNNTWFTSNKVRQKNGGVDGFDCITTGSVAKNILLVGAAHKLQGEYTSPSDVRMASFSAYGPVDDGRIKPDITGIGYGLISSNIGADNAYASLSGTSMASPNVAGSLLLLQELYSKKNGNEFMKGATLKALAIATAAEAGAAPGPDYSSGWGLLDSYKAATTISLNGVYSLIQESKLLNGRTESLEVVASGNEPLKVTIVWDDPASPKLSNTNVLDDPTKMLVNDLDVKVTKDGEEFRAWVLNPANPSAPATRGDNVVDNVEQVMIESPTPGATYKITVSHKGQLKKPVSASNFELVNAQEQAYSMIVTGINMGSIAKDVALNSVNIEVEPVAYSTSTPVKFSVENKGTEDVTGVKVHYILTNEDSNSVEKEGDIEIGALTSGQIVDKTVMFDLSKSFVNYKIQGIVEFTGDQIGFNNRANTTAFGTIAKVTQKGEEHFFGFENDFKKYGWTSEDLDGDGQTWTRFINRAYAYQSLSSAINYPKSENGTDDWLFSNPIKLKAGELYRVEFYVKKFKEMEETLTLGIGTQAKSTAMTMIPNSKTEAKLGYVKHSYEFKVSNDDAYYIGFHHKQEQKTFAIALDNVKVSFAEGPPEANFYADNTRPTTYDVVTLMDNSTTASTLPITEYKWRITPTGAYDYVEGTTKYSKNPKVKFNEERSYSVTLRVKNGEGRNTQTREHYIRVSNEAAKADFSVSSTYTYEGSPVELTNLSTGRPKPTTFQWYFTPSEGVEYVNNTNANSENPVVKFNTPGVYTVELKVESISGTSNKRKPDLIEVKSVYNPVEDLAYDFNDANSQLKLTWKRPTLRALYKEDFSGGQIPSEMTVIDENRDGNTWYVQNGAAYSASWVYPSAITSNDWLLTPKIDAGAERLKFEVKHTNRERYNVYIVPAKADGTVPTAAEILSTGKRVYSFNAQGVKNDFTEEVIDIASYTKKDFYVAFYHKTKFVDEGGDLILDNIYVGYDNGNNQVKKGTYTPYEPKNKEGNPENNEMDRDFLDLRKEESLPNKEEGIITIPRLTGYEVKKDNVAKGNLSGEENRTYTETIHQGGVYTYDVYAVYSDGKKAEKRTIIVDLSSLATGEVEANQAVEVYPNPSNGLFTVSVGSGVIEFSANVYDLAGKKVYSNTFQGNTAELNLTQYVKGVYILKLMDNNGKQKSVKLVIK